MRTAIVCVAMVAVVWNTGTVVAAPVCGDVNDDENVTTSDALAVLRTAVGQEVPLACAFCGDGLIASGEQCEPGNLDGESCATLGFAGGTLACATGCAFDTDGCYSERFDGSGPTIVDRETGLEWEKKEGDIKQNIFSTCPGGDTCDNPHWVGNYYKWSSAASAADGGAFTDILSQLNAGSTGSLENPTAGCYAGHCDWRLPTLEELRTIVTHCGAPPCVVDPVFESSGITYYWSRTSHESSPNYAWTVHLNSPEAQYIVTNRVKTNTYQVRAVRGPN